MRMCNYISIMLSIDRPPVFVLIIAPSIAGTPLVVPNSRASSQGASSRIQPRILCHLSHRSHRWLHKFWWLHQFRWLEICVKSLRRPLAKTTLASKNPHNERPMCLVTSHTEYCILTSGKRIKPIPSLSQASRMVTALATLLANSCLNFILLLTPVQFHYSSVIHFLSYQRRPFTVLASCMYSEKS